MNMKKLIRQDLIEFLTLAGDCRSCADGLGQSVESLLRRSFRDYLFWTDQGESYLFPFYEIYVPDSCASLCWTDRSPGQTQVCYLYTGEKQGWSRGTVILLDSGEVDADLERTANLTLREKMVHLLWLLREWRNHASLCSLREMVTMLKQGGDR